MTKADVLNELIESCIEQAPSGVWYVTPMWRETECLQDYDGDFSELLEVLKLTVEKKNAIDNQVRPVLDWLYKLMTDTVDTKLDDAEIDLMNGAIAYLTAGGNGARPKVNIDGWNFSKRNS